MVNSIFVIYCGFYLFQYLKDRDYLRDIPLVYLTAWNVKWDEYKEITENALIFEKPVNADDLYKIVNKTIMKND